MLRRTLVLSLIGTAFLPACNPTPTPAGTQPVATCGFSPNQGAAGLAMDCTITGGLPRMRVDPVGPSPPACGPLTFTLFGQTVNAPVRAIFGENGDDSPARVRLGATITGATHSGTFAKSVGANCNSTDGPRFPVSTAFGGRHIALVDKEQRPMCVFQSRLDLAPYRQDLGVGIPVEISGLTQAAVRDALARRLDFELASAVNRLLAPGTNLGGVFATNFGRCADGHQVFVGN
jgi:hypothetical protein